MNTHTSQIKFQKDLWDFYNMHGRHAMLWRQNTNSYNIVVSEIMLQQTGVERVEPKYIAFTSTLPSWHTLASSPNKQLLGLWQGLGYNRRALYLQKTAQEIVTIYNGVVPKNRTLLEKLPGIGPGTSGAIMAYAFNKPEVFIETNIRRVIIHHFFTDQTQITDSQITTTLQNIITDIQASHSPFSPRTFYWAMMDYGSYLKSQVPNPNKQSRRYSVQSQFEGSNRQLRGKVLAFLLTKPQASEKELLSLASSKQQHNNFIPILKQLQDEGFIQKHQSKFVLL
ncbi:A/G-specific adenine glycosylase [Candidatus Saccharibacteria bacterium]|nr:A/G-specific adenine glycosylase [Candidatus Saccharibacteria bacterium]